MAAQQIDDILYADDDRIANYSTRYVSLKPDGMRYGQAYPNWNPIFKDGTSAIAPYTFSEGTPPYNYLLTYRIPGDPTYYKIELADGKNVQRFADSGVPAWYSATGAAPNPSTNSQYFITNTDAEWSRCEFVGNWPGMEDANADPYNSEYSGYNYQYHSAGTGQNLATFTLLVRAAGNYTVTATWKSDAANASNAKFTINHAAGSTVVGSGSTRHCYGNKYSGYLLFQPGLGNGSAER